MPISAEWRTILAWLALAGVVGEIATAFIIEFPAAAIVMAALFLVGWYLLRRGSLAGVILVGLLWLVELGFLPTYDRDDAADWIIVAVFGILGIAALIAAAGVLLTPRGARPQ